MKRFIGQIAYKYSLPIAVKGWGCWDSSATVQYTASFMRQAMAAMDDDTRVMKCAQESPVRPAVTGCYPASFVPRFCFHVHVLPPSDCS